jgi:hypothetical protein
MEERMRELMFQTYPDSCQLWHWVAFGAEGSEPIECKRTFDSREEAEWDARRFIGVYH